MSTKLKTLDQQVMVITGATSGIGLATARMAAEGGARLVLAARDGDALDTLAHELRQRGVEVATVTADVGSPADVARISQVVMDRFGRVDTWVNNAGISVYGRNEDVALEDMRKVMQTNFWGVVHGSLEAVRLMKGRGGGALINLGSEVSDRSVPLQGTYSASKHAIKAFTDSLRMELDKEDAGIALTVIKPAAIATPFTSHAKSYMEHEPDLPPPNYAPELVAEAILHAAQVPERDLYVGGHSKLTSVLGYLAPRTLDRFMSRTMFSRQQTERPNSSARRDALYAPDAQQELRERNSNGNHPVVEHSPYTSFEMRSAPAKTVLLGGALLAAWALSRKPWQRRVWHA
jgi:short-subunit dehydrogenase